MPSRFDETASLENQMEPSEPVLLRSNFWTNVDSLFFSSFFREAGKNKPGRDREFITPS